MHACVCVHVHVCACVSHFKELSFHLQHDTEGQQVISSQGTALHARALSGGPRGSLEEEGPLSSSQWGAEVRVPCRRRAGDMKLSGVPAQLWGLPRRHCVPPASCFQSLQERTAPETPQPFVRLRFKATFRAASSLSSSRHPKSPSGARGATTSSYPVFWLQCGSPARSRSSSPPVGTSCPQPGPALHLDVPSPTETSLGQKRGLSGRVTPTERPPGGSGQRSKC